jgi:molybdate transport system regulatory protein
MKSRLRYSYRLYLDAAGKRVLGKGGAQILEAIDRTGSITAAAAQLEMSYKFVWDYLMRIGEILNEPIIVTRRGGSAHHKKKGGGGTILTPLGNALLKEFRLTEASVNRTLSQRSINLHSSTGVSREERILDVKKKPHRLAQETR